MMKLKFFSRLIMVFILTLTITGCNTSDDKAGKITAGAEWSKIGSTSTGDTYYSKNSIKEVRDNVFLIQTKAIYSDGGKKEKFLFLKSIDSAPDNSEMLSHELRLWHVDCAANKINPFSSTIYNTENNIIVSSPEFPDKWDDILPNSLASELKNIVCPAK